MTVSRIARCLCGSSSYLSFYRGSIFFVSTPTLGGHTTELDQTLPHVGSEPGLKMHVQNLGYFSPKIKPKTTYFDVFRRIRNFTSTLAVKRFTFGMNQEIDNRGTALETTEGPALHCPKNSGTLVRKRGK